MIFLAKRFLILEILEILEILLHTIKIAGETLSDARMASESPRATGTSRPEGAPTEHIEI